MRRLVVSTRTYRPERTQLGAFRIIDLLECGHEISVKGSVGYASYRECRECQQWSEGHVGSKRIGDRWEKWNPETQMPYWEEVAKD